MKRCRVDTDKIVSEALKQEVEEKDQKKKGKRVRFSDVSATREVPARGLGGGGGGGGGGAAGPSCEGPVREDLLETAQKQRAIARKGNSKQEDVEWVSDVRKIEEDFNADMGGGEGEQFEPFNLNEEREEGDFQADGFYVRRQEDQVNDAWLSSDGAKVCSSKLQKQHEEMQKRMEASDKASGMSIAEITECKKTIVDLLNQRETVIQGLRRLGGKKPSGKKSGNQADDDPSDAGDPRAFARLTEAADALMSNGDGDVYICHKEEFEHAVSMFTPTEAKMEEDDGDDMFGDSDGDDDPKCQTTTRKNGSEKVSNLSSREAQNGGTETTAGTQPPHPSEVLPPVNLDIRPAAVPEVQMEDFDSWPISELKRFLEERGESTEGIVEKVDLVKKAVEEASKGPEGEVDAAPAGFVFDPSSGYFHCAESGLYFDSGSSSFYVSSTGKWYSKDWQELGVGV